MDFLLSVYLGKINKYVTVIQFLGLNNNYYLKINFLVNI